MHTYPIVTRITYLQDLDRILQHAQGNVILIQDIATSRKSLTPPRNRYVLRDAADQDTWVDTTVEMMMKKGAQFTSTQQVYEAVVKGDVGCLVTVAVQVLFCGMISLVCLCLSVCLSVCAYVPKKTIFVW